MARTVQDAKLDTRAARRRLKQRREPHWRSISEGLAIGYRRGTKGGTWIARHYSGEHGRRFRSIGTTDDVADADGAHVLSFAQAQELARRWFADLARHDRGEVVRNGPYTVRDCTEEYLAWLNTYRKSGYDARHRVHTHIGPHLANIRCDQLTTARIQRWLRNLADSPARLRTKKDAKSPNFREFNKADQDAVRRRRASANRTLTVLKAALNRAWREGKIRSDEAWRRVEPFAGVDAARVRYLTVTEAKRLVNASDPDFRSLVQAGLVTGARYGELASLRVVDFNPDSRTLHVRTSKSGKGRHIVLTDEGATLFKRLTAGKPGELLPADESRRFELESRTPSAPDGRSMQTGKDRSADFISLPAAYLGFAFCHGRRSTHGRRAQSRSQRHAHGRAALRTPSTKLYRGCNQGYGTPV